jgi:hypothetical protein
MFYEQVFISEGSQLSDRKETIKRTNFKHQGITFKDKN